MAASRALALRRRFGERGRGGPEHRAITAEIIALAHSLEYTAEREGEAAAGFADAALQKGGRRIAVEVAAQSSTAQEMHNLTKCLGAGFDFVVSVSPAGSVRKNIRRANREAKALDSDENGTIVWFKDTLEEDERSAQIEKAIQGLPEYYKEVIILKIWGELTFEQIAETLDIPMNTAASRYRYALEKLRRTLTPAKLA